MSLFRPEGLNKEGILARIALRAVGARAQSFAYSVIWVRSSERFSRVALAIWLR